MTDASQHNDSLTNREKCLSEDSMVRHCAEQRPDVIQPVHLDTGIAHLGGEEISFDNIPLPEPLKSKLQEDVKEGMTVRLLVLDFTILDLRIQAQQGLSLQIADTVLIKREFHG
jgi:hypothetical protein